MIEIIPNWHPLLVHFPIVLTTAALFFVVMGQVAQGKSYATQHIQTGRWLLSGAALFACIAALFGWLASNSVAHDAPSHAAMLEHRNWALTSVMFLLLLALWDGWQMRVGKLRLSVLLPMLVLAWLLVVSTAWHGGELVYRYGLGVMSLPKAEGAGHSHAHGEEHGATADLNATAHAHDEGIKAMSTAPQQAVHEHPADMPPHQD